MEKHPVVESRFNVINHVVRGDRGPLLKQFNNDNRFFNALIVEERMAFKVGQFHPNNSVSGVRVHHGRFFG